MLLGVVLLFAVAALGTAGAALADDPADHASPPWIASDKGDYAPGELVTLSGGSWAPVESVHIYVNDDQGKTWERSVDVEADENGNISDSFNLPDRFVASYSVNATGASSGTATTSFTDAISTITTLQSSLNPSQAGQSVTFTATITCSSTCTFSGQAVDFADNANNNCNGGTNLGSTTTLTGSGNTRTATFTTSSLSTGTHSIRACFNGGGSGLTPGSSVSDPLAQVVNAGAPNKLAFTAQPTNTVANNTIGGATGVKVAIQDAAGNTNALSTASVTIAIGANPGSGTLNGTATVNAVNGVATFSSLSIDEPGTGYTLSATSSGVTGAPSNSFNVTAAATTTVVTCTPTTLVVDQSAACTATVTDTATVKTMPTGSVSWATNNSGGSNQFSAASCTLAASATPGVASCQTTYTPSNDVNDPTLTATYAADSDHAGSSGTRLLTVDKRTTTVSVGCFPNSVGSGQPTTCTATVTDTSANGTKSTPTGTVGSWSSDRSGTFTPASCSLSGSGDSATCSVAFTPSQGGNHNIRASYLGDTKHLTNTSPSSVLPVNTLPATTLSVAASAGTFGGTVTLSATLRNASTSAVISGRSIAFKLNATSVGSATTNSSGVAALNGVSLSGIAVGTHAGAIVGTFSGDASFNGSTGSNTLTVNPACTAASVAANPADQSITYGADATFTAAGDGDPAPTVQWQLSIDSGANWNNVPGETSTTLALTKPSMSLSGNKYRAAFANTCGETQTATTAAATLTVAKAQATLSFAGGTLARVYDGSPKLVTVDTDRSGLSGVSVSYDGGGTAPSNAGSYALVASLENANYQAAPINGTLVIDKAEQTISFAAVAAKTFGDADFAPGASASSGLAVSYSTGAGDDCTIVAGEVHITGAGSCTVTASQAGNGNYNAADPVSQTFSIAKAQATLSFAGGTLARVYDGSPKLVTVDTDPSGLSGVSVSYDGGGTAPSNAGSYALVASLENANYQAAPINGTLVIDKAEQTISFAAVAAKKLGDPDFTINATASSGLPVTFASQTSTVCTVSGDTVHIVTVGTCTVRASQAGNGNYDAVYLDRSFAITYVFTGFYRPIDNKDASGNSIMNIAKAGSTIPMKFSLNGNQGLAIFTAGSPSSGAIACEATTTDTVEEYSIDQVSSLKYDAAANQYVYNWKTDGKWSGTCRQLSVKFSDGTTQRANFKFNK